MNEFIAFSVFSLIAVFVYFIGERTKRKDEERMNLLREKEIKVLKNFKDLKEEYEKIIKEEK